MAPGSMISKPMFKYIAIFLVPILPTFFLSNIVTDITYSDYKDTLSALLNISSIVFAIIGAWIAIIFPRAMGRVFQGKVALKEIEDSSGDTSYLSELVETVMVSAVVLMLVLIIQFLVPILKNVFPSGHLKELKMFGFYFVTSMTLAQLCVISRVILANYFFLNQLRNKDVKDSIDQLHK